MRWLLVTLLVYAALLVGLFSVDRWAPNPVGIMRAPSYRTPPPVAEDDPGWDCRTQGNLHC